MTAPKFTPGKWEANYGGVGYRDQPFKITEYFVRLAGDDVAIAADIIDPVSGEPSEANAHLIAAAPELYEALAEAFEREYNPFEPDNQSERYHRWRALLRKARGESA